MRTLGQFVALLLVGFVGAYFWPIALTAAAVLTCRIVLHALSSAPTISCDFAHSERSGQAQELPVSSSHEPRTQSRR